MEFYPRQNLVPLRLDGTWKLNSSQKLNGYKSDSQVDFYPMGVGVIQKVAAELSADAGIYIPRPMDGSRKLDGTWKLNGSREAL